MDTVSPPLNLCNDFAYTFLGRQQAESSHANILTHLLYHRTFASSSDLAANIPKNITKFPYFRGLPRTEKANIAFTAN